MAAREAPKAVVLVNDAADEVAETKAVERVFVVILDVYPRTLCWTEYVDDECHHKAEDPARHVPLCGVPCVDLALQALFPLVGDGAPDVDDHDYVTPQVVRHVDDGEEIHDDGPQHRRRAENAVIVHPKSKLPFWENPSEQKIIDAQQLFVPECGRTMSGDHTACAKEERR